MNCLTVLCIILIVIIVFLMSRGYVSDQKVYLDNNGTTQQYKKVIDVIYDTSNSGLGNASGIYADEAKNIISQFKLKLLQILSLDENDAKIIVTSGGSESNNLIIRGCVDHFW